MVFIGKLEFIEIVGMIIIVIVVMIVNLGGSSSTAEKDSNL